MTGMEKEAWRYKLWREYLKRSDTYKIFCEWMGEFQKDIKTPRPKEFTNKMDGIFAMFGDVHKEPFNQWWETHKKIFRCFEYEGINDYSKFIEGDIEDCVSDSNPRNAKSHLAEFKTLLSTMRNDKDIVYLCIAVGGRQKRINNTIRQNHYRDYKQTQQEPRNKLQEKLTTVLGAKSKDDYMRKMSLRDT